VEFSPCEIRSRIEWCRRMSRRAVTQEEREDWRCPLGLDDGQTQMRSVARDAESSQAKVSFACGWR
jgi:hypothetical protein